MKHDILVKYNETVTDKKAMEAEVRNLFQGVLSVEGVHGVAVIPNTVERPNRYDLLIEIEMEPSALSAYDECETHKQWKKNYAQYLEGKAIFDHD
ncbi:MAG: hypothetical protein LKM41_12100 [Lachnospiraceae bacterium]|jgi:divalent metal cation (Fe/Co/Zn/Cd) transporter|nr:hypothetical protein [Lachnospiraceae bacterium]